MRGINKHPDPESPHESASRSMFVPAFITKTLENLHELKLDEVLIVEDSPQPENVTQDDISTEDDNEK